MGIAINTVTGSIDSSELGRTLIHEHVLIGFPGWYMDARQPAFKRDEAVERVVDAFQALHAYGVRTVIDPCPMDMGRDVELYAEVSQKSGINGSVAKIVKLEHAWRRLDGRNDDGFQVAPFPG